MQQILEKLLGEIDTIIAGVPLNFEDVPQDKRETLLVAAIHCCINGPVGVNKKTTFPRIGELKIKEYVPCSNKGWRGLCHEVALMINKMNPQLKCNTKSLKGNLWPLYEA